jgi:ABC-type methionine transport system ATPase subunit
MARRRVMLTFPQELLREPIIYVLGQEFEVVTNILQADVSESKGWTVLELEGEETAIDNAIAWAMSKGIRVDTYQTPI